MCCTQLRTRADTTEKETADAGGGGMVDVDSLGVVRLAILMVRVHTLLKRTLKLTVLPRAVFWSGRTLLYGHSCQYMLFGRSSIRAQNMADA